MKVTLGEKNLNNMYEQRQYVLIAELHSQVMLTL